MDPIAFHRITEGPQESAQKMRLPLASYPSAESITFAVVDDVAGHKIAAFHSRLPVEMNVQEFVAQWAKAIESSALAVLVTTFPGHEISAEQQDALLMKTYMNMVTHAERFLENITRK